MIAEIESAAKDGDSLGGIVEVLAYGMPVGWVVMFIGSKTRWIISPSDYEHSGCQGVEIGDGFEVATRRGKQCTRCNHLGRICKQIFA